LKKSNSLGVILKDVVKQVVHDSYPLTAYAIIEGQKISNVLENLTPKRRDNLGIYNINNDNDICVVASEARETAFTKNQINKQCTFVPLRNLREIKNYPSK
jgi:hypothetical protein